MVCFGLALAPRRAAAESKRLVIVVAKESRVTDIKRGDLRRVYLGEPMTVEGKPLVPFNAMPNTRERAAFDRAILGMSPDQAGRFWVDRKVRGQGGAPRSLPSNLHIVKVVAKFPNAISYVPADQLTAFVQAVKIDGLAYNDPNYPIIMSSEK